MDDEQPSEATLPLPDSGEDPDRTLRVEDEGTSSAVEQRGKQIGDYVIERELGHGGQGTVYLARDVRLNRLVALKLLSGALGFSAEARRRFRREAETASKLEHPGICTVFDFGEYQGIPYLAMQYLDGRPLDFLIRSSRGPEEDASGTPVQLEAPTLIAGPDDSGSGSYANSNVTPQQPGSVPAVLTLMEGAARALHAAHEVGLVHRDVKPGNIMVARDGRPVILDFGLARDEESEGPTLTASGDMMGTPAYMSPEQITGPAPRIDRRSDVWSLGVTLYECLTLVRPFSAPTLQGLYSEILEREPRDPRRLNPRMVDDLKVVLDTALEKDLARRYQTAEALAEDLRAVREHRPIAARPVSAFGRLRRWARRQPALATLVAVLAVAVPGLVGLGTWNIMRQPLVELAQAEKLARQNDAHISSGFMAMEEGRIADARRELDAARVEGRIVPEALAGLVLLAVRQGAFAEALTALESHSATVKATAGLQALEIFCRARVQGDSETEALAREAPDPRDPVDFFLIGLRDIARAEGGATRAWSDASRNLAQAVLRAPAPRPIYHFQLLYAAGRDEDEVILTSVAEAACALWPDSPATFWWCGHAWQVAGHLEHSKELFEKALAVDPRFARAHTSLGVHYRFSKQSDLAAKAFARAIELAPEAAQPHLYWGNLCIETRQMDEAVKHLEEALRLDANDDDAHHNIAMVLDHLERKPEALKHHRAAVAIDPGYVPWRRSLVEALADSGAFAEAAKNLGEAARLNPKAGLDLSLAALRNGLILGAATAFHAIDVARPDLLAPQGTRDNLYQAARAAARCSTGDGADAGAVDAAGRSAWRARAHMWLARDLKLWEDQLGQTPTKRSSIRRRWHRWLEDPAFAPLRDEKALQALPAEESRAWSALWIAIATAVKDS